MQSKNYEQAIRLYREVLAQNEENSRAYYNLAWIYANTARPKEMIEISQEALNFVAHDQKFKFYRFIGNGYTQMDSLAQGASYFTQAMRLNADDYLTVYNYGYNRFKAQDFQTAIPLLERSLTMETSIESNVDDTYFYIGTAYSEMGEMEKSLPYFDTAIAGSTYYSYYFNKAEAYSRLKQYDKGIETCNEGLLHNPENARLYFKQHQLYRNAGDEENSYQSIFLAYLADNEDPDILLDMGVALSNENKTDEALRLYRKALQNTDEKGPIYSNMASLFAKNKLTVDTAIYYHQKAIEATPGNFIPYLNYGNCLRDLERYDEAIEMYAKAYALNDGNDVVIGNMAVAYMQKEEAGKAKEWLEIGLEKFPNDFEMSSLRARIALEEKAYALAEKYASIALKNLKPGKSKLVALSIRANARQLNGNYKDAIPDYLEILHQMSEETKKQNADIFSNIGFCYLYQQEYAHAEKYFLECLNYDDEIDALLGMLFVSHYTQDKKGLKRYKKQARKTYPPLKNGAKGLKKLEEEGYHYSKEEYEIIDEVFGK